MITAEPLPLTGAGKVLLATTMAPEGPTPALTSAALGVGLGAAVGAAAGAAVGIALVAAPCTEEQTH